VHEPLVSRDHTERMLSALGVPIRAVGAMVELDAAAWSGSLPAFSIRVPGDLSAAAFLIVAAQIVPNSRVDVRRVGLNPTRTGILDIIRAMGGQIDAVALGDELGEPVGDVHAAAASLTGGRIGGEIVPRAVDEIPIACALAARARGETTIFDATELRVKESDRLATMARVLRAFGVACEEREDGLVIQGVPDRPLTAADVTSDGDHRVAMTAVILGLLGDGPTRVRDAGCIATSFPRFVGTMRALGARIEVIEGEGAA
jgi:3-phosphoshikimate 1-carboxyvinyltransferase